MKHKHHPHEMTASQLEEAVHSASEEILIAAARHHSLTDDLAMTLLKRISLPGEVLRTLAANGRVMKHRKVRMGIVTHQKTPRFVSMPLLRHLYTFELMRLALIPIVAADVKRAAEDLLTMKAKTLSSGERLTLAKQGSSRTAAALLHDEESRVIHAALNNPRMTEVHVVRALLLEEALQPLTLAVCTHHKWSLRKDIRGALLRNPHTPLAHAILCAGSFRHTELEELFHQSGLPKQIQTYLLETAAARRRRGKEPADELELPG